MQQSSGKEVMSSEESKFLKKYGPWAIVTGASSGIGAQFCRSLAQRGLNVILIARRVDRLDALAAEISSKHSIQTHVLAADLTKPNAAVEIGAALSEYDVGLLVNNAGVEAFGAYAAESLEKIQYLIALNVTAVAALSRIIGPRLAKRKRGGMIFVSSMAARPSPYCAVYAASKALITTLAVSMRYELCEYGVEVMALEPGLVQTEMVDRGAEYFDVSKMTKMKVMGAEETVENAISAFGRKAVHTPGWMNRAMKTLEDYLPLWCTRPYAAKVMRKGLLPERLALSP